MRPCAILFAVVLAAGCGSNSTKSGLPKKSYDVSLVFFHQAGSEPSAKQRAILGEFKKEKPQVAVQDVDIDSQVDLAKQWRVQAVPTILVLVGNAAIERLEGLQTQEQISKAIDRALGKAK